MWSSHQIGVGGGLRRDPMARSSAVVGVVLGVVGALAVSALYSTIASAASQSPAQYEQEAVAAAQAAGSLRVTANVTQTELEAHKSVSTKSVIEMNQTESTSVVTSGKAHGTLLVVPNLAYTEGNAAYLYDIVGLSKAEASKYAGQWISLSSSYKYYLSLTYGHIVSQLGAVATASVPLTLTSPKTVDGIRVVGVSGGLSAPLSVVFGKNGKQTLYVSTSSPYRPTSFVCSAVTRYGANENVRAVESDTLSNWGESVSVTPPATSVPIATITGS